MRAVTEMQERRNKILSALEEYVDLGLPVIPLCAHDHKGYSERHISRCNQAGKIPLIRGWQTHETTSRAQVKEWVREFKNINIGLPLGHVSGYVGIDVDGSLGEDMLVDMSNGDLPETWEYVTGAGRRLLYSIPVGMMTKKHVNTGVGDHQECSILAFGQQTVLPPSVHHTGRIYEWVDGRSPEDLDCAMAPTWLLNLVRQDNKSTPGTIDLTSMKPSYVPPVKEEETVEIGPILVTDDTLHVEFIDFEDLSMDLGKPDTSYVGKEAKMQEKEESGPELLEMVVSAGGRDNHMTKVVGYLCAKNRNLGREGIMLLAKSINITKIQPPLDDMAIESKVNHFWETEEMKSAHYKNLSSSDDKKQFEPIVVAQVLLNILEEEGYTLKADPNTPAVWMTRKDEGPWEQYYLGGDASEFHMYIIKALTHPTSGDSKWTHRKHYGEVATNLIILLKQQNRIWYEADVETQKADSHKYIPLAGGKLLDWKTGELKPWDPETNLTYVVPVDYDPKAKCPNWENRLAQWLPDTDVRKVIQEFVGYALIPYMGFEKALWIKGEGANGKSLFLETIQRMLGRKISASSNMAFLFGRFGAKTLLGKIMNIVNEAGADYLKGGNADVFKNMVSGGEITADVKNKEPIIFNNKAKFMFSANHDIGTSDKSAAWQRRIILIPFDQDFRKSTETKTEILEPIWEEFPGIFNWAVEGLQRLMSQKGFTESKVITQEVERYINKNDVAADFFTNCLSAKPELSVSGSIIERGVATSAVVELFKLWTEYRGTTLKKHDQRIKEYLTKSKNLTEKRLNAPKITLSDAKKTTCWVNLSIQVNDPDFLERVIDNQEHLAVKPTLRMYIERRLEELNEMPNPPSPTPITDLPSASGN